MSLSPQPLRPQRMWFTIAELAEMTTPNGLHGIEFDHCIAWEILALEAMGAWGLDLSHDVNPAIGPVGRFGFQPTF